MSYKTLISVSFLLTSPLVWTDTLGNGLDATAHFQQEPISNVSWNNRVAKHDPLRSQPKPYRVTVQLPDPFIQLFNDTGLDLLKQIHLEGCDAKLENTSEQSNVFSTEACDTQPTALRITGFMAIPPTQIDGQHITFSPDEIAIEVSISASLTYYLKTPRLDNIKVSDTLPLSYQDIGQDLLFRVNPSEETQPCITKRLSLTEVIQEKRSLKLEPTPVPVRWLNTIAYRENYAIYQYPDKTACRTGTDPNRLSYYTAATQPDKMIPCVYVKLFDEINDKPASRCSQPIQQQNQWVIDFEPYQCGEKRKLIVVSTGEQLDRTGGKRIPQTLVKVLQNQFQNRPPFTVVTVKPGRELSEALLQCEDLADLEESEAKAQIRRQVQTIRFGATDLRALADLDLVNLVYPKEKLHSVLYITDNSGIPADIERINDKHLSVPLITWKRAKIPLTVLTSGSCEPWLKRAEAETCDTLQRQQAVTQIQSTLKAFLTEEN